MTFQRGLPIPARFASAVKLTLVAGVVVSFAAHTSNAQTPGKPAMLVGSTSCATATCHGAPIGDGPAWNQSYSISRARDPHAGAAALLYDIDSRRIVQRLVPEASSATAYDLVLRQRCISCHMTATAEDLVSSEPLDPSRVGEGVSCESCHGHAEKWMTPHVLTSWKGPERFEPSTGMLDTETLVSRTENCMRCHIGSRRADGMTRDMNHDLIAAGHPALRFDMLVYHQNMPAHWDSIDSGEAVAQQTIDFEREPTKVRAVGQSMGIVMGARLSAERAEDSQASRSTNQQSQSPGPPHLVPWPELSDFDCFACHQSLSPKSYRLPKTVDGKPSLSISNGLPLWNGWFAASLAAGGDESLWSLKAKPGGQSEWIDRARQIEAMYRQRADEEASQAATTPQFKPLFDRITVRAPANWNEASITLLESDAIARQRLISPETTEAEKAQAQRIVSELRKDVAPLLRFGAVAHAKRSRSPERFDSRVFHETLLNVLQQVKEDR